MVGACYAAVAVPKGATTFRSFVSIENEASTAQKNYVTLDVSNLLKNGKKVGQSQ